MHSFFAVMSCAGAARVTDEDSDLPPIADRRPASRNRVLLSGILSYDSGGHSFRCSIRDLSATGARISLPPGFTVPRPVFLIEIRARIAHEAERIWSDNKSAGLKFIRTIALDKLDDPSLAYLKRLLDAASS
jgi:hypothetical protein